MFFKLYRITLVFAILCSMTVSAQTQDENKKQREEYEKKVQENLSEGIQKFISQLQIDDFQKEIIKQKLQSYYQEQRIIYTNSSLKYFERDEQITSLNNSHFEDIKNMISEDTMNQIQLFIKDFGTTLQKQKKKNKKNKKTNDE